MFDIKCVYAGIYIDVEMNDAGVRIELTRNARDLIQNQTERERAGVCISHHFRLSSFHFNISLHLITFALIAVIATTHQRAENSLTTFLILVLVSHNVDYILQFETLFSYAWLSSFYTIWGSSLELRGLSSCETHLLKGFFVQFLLWPYAYVCECVCVCVCLYK